MAVRIAPSADVASDAVIGAGSSIWHLAQVREGAQMGAGCVVGRGAYIGSGVRMGANCKVQNYALVYEPAELADGVFIGPAVVLTNDTNPRAVNPDGSPKSATDWEPVGVHIAEGASIGARAVCVAPLRIGAWATIAAGSVVTRDVPAHALVMGVPARQVGWVGRAGHRLVPDDLVPDADASSPPAPLRSAPPAPPGSAPRNLSIDTSDWYQSTESSTPTPDDDASASAPEFLRCPVTGQRYALTGSTLREVDSE